ncbi:MAG: PrsW family intramembrane metalloprotease [Actinomycetota bacterium]
MEIFSSPSFFVTYAVIQTVIFLLLIRFLDLYEHEPFSLLALMALWGAVGATGISIFGNEVFADVISEDVYAVFGAAISAPIIEEFSKGLALLLAFGLSSWAHRRFGSLELHGVTDGIVYGAAIGLGFAFTEDIYYLLDSAAQEGLREGIVIFLRRRDFFGTGMLHHAIFTATFGVGLGLATWARSSIGRITWALSGFVLAMLLHATNNGLVQLMLVRRFGFDSTVNAISTQEFTPAMDATISSTRQAMLVLDYAVAVAFFVGIALWLYHQRKVIRAELADEADSGLIDPRDGELVPSYFRRVLWYWQLTRIGELERVRAVRRLHIELAKLALEKWVLRRRGGNPEAVTRSRQRIATLKAQGAVDVYAPSV